MRRAQASASRRSPEGRSVLGVLVAAAAVIGGGFAFGLVAGVLLEDPALILDHVTGRTTRVSLAEIGTPPSEAERPTDAPGAPPSVAAGEPAGAPQPARPQPAASRPDVASAPPGSGFSVQVGAFADSDSARRLAGQLEQAGFPVYVAPAEQAPDARWRVRVGPVSTREEAERLAERLKRERRLPTWVLAERPR